jgi:hypothetical protein
MMAKEGTAFKETNEKDNIFFPLWFNSSSSVVPVRLHTASKMRRKQNPRKSSTAQEKIDTCFLAF